MLLLSNSLTLMRMNLCSEDCKQSAYKTNKSKLRKLMEILFIYTVRTEWIFFIEWNVNCKKKQKDLIHLKQKDLNH